jgi:protocatechuate 3,4-dioxygenase beta subunit
MTERFDNARQQRGRALNLARHGTAMALLLLALPFASAESSAAEKVVGLPCEGCESVFDGMPATFTSRARIADLNEKGDAMLVEGVVRGQDGKPAPGIVVYAYQTNAGGLYPPNEKFTGSTRRHGMLRGWAITDASGRYAFGTIRPGGYPGTNIPEHIHMHVIERGRCTYYIDDIVFTDDPRLTPAQRRQHDNGRGGSGVVTPAKDGKTWKVTRDIVLGQRIGGHDNCK